MRLGGACLARGRATALRVLLRAPALTSPATPIAPSVLAPARVLVLAFVLVLALAFVLAWRALARGWVERRAARAHPPGRDGIIAGAGTITLAAPTAAPAVLLLHGFGDTPQSLAALAAAVHAAGFAVDVPLLPGHGRTLRAFASSGADQWLASATAAYDALRARHARVGVVGQSMGGALAVLVAAERPDARALVLLAPFLDAPSVLRWVGRAHWLVGALLPYLPARAERSIHDPVARAESVGHGTATARLVHELVALAARARSALPRLAAPTLLVQSRLDNRVAPAVAGAAMARLGAPVARLVWLDASGHVITVDRERERVAELVTGWLAEHLRA